MGDDADQLDVCHHRAQLSHPHERCVDGNVPGLQQEQRAQPAERLRPARREQRYHIHWCCRGDGRRSVLPCGCDRGASCATIVVGDHPQQCDAAVDEHVGTDGDLRRAPVCDSRDSVGQRSDPHQRQLGEHGGDVLHCDGWAVDARALDRRGYHGPRVVKRCCEGQQHHDGGVSANGGWVDWVHCRPH